MRVELRAAGDGDVVARVDRDLPAGDVVRDGNQLRVGAPEPLDGDALRAAAAAAARSLRADGGPLAWRVHAAHARALHHDHLRVETHGRDWIVTQGMGAFAAVGSASPEEPQLIVLRYEPPGAPDSATLGLVGKAITFDSGGISLKPPLRMQ